MDNRGFDEARYATDSDPAEGGVGEATIDIGADERRMHVRAYNHWVSLLKGRAYPSIEDLDPAGIADFGAHSVRFVGLAPVRRSLVGRLEGLGDACRRHWLSAFATPVRRGT